MTLLHHTDLEFILIMIYCFVDDFVKALLSHIHYALKRPDQHTPPTKKHNLSIAELATLAIFRFFTGQRDWKSFYRHIKTYHLKDFPHLPEYNNFLTAINKLSGLAAMMLNGFMQVFRKITKKENLKFTDGMKLRVCEIKREFSHKVCKGLAIKSKTTMGWFYGFKLHIICNELMQILELKITTATRDERKALESMWCDIFGIIIADAGYISKKLQERGRKLGKYLITGVRANMKKIMT